MSAEVLSSRPEALVSDLLTRGVPVELVVTGGSMAPWIRGGDTITLAPLGDRSVRLGEVVAFPRPDGRLVIHRVVALEAERLQTRGDAVSAADAWIDRKILIGRVESLRRDRRPMQWGLGREKTMIARLSRAGLLRPLLRPLRWWVRIR